MAVRSGRPFLSIRRNQVASMESSQDNDLHELDLFQTHVADRLLSLSDYEDRLPQGSQRVPLAETTEESKTQHHFVLTIAFLQNLMDFFLACDEEFRALLSRFFSSNSTAFAKVERVTSEHLDRSVKSLDICNAVTQSLDTLCHSQKLAAIAAGALTAQLPIGEGRMNRAKNALEKLLAAIAERPADGATSFGRSSRGLKAAAPAATSRFPQRTLSLSVFKNWSAAQQLRAMMGTLHPPRGGEGSAMALAFYTMSSVQVLVMWIIVAAFPSQECPPALALLAPPRQLPWAGAMTTLQERVVEEWKKKMKKKKVATSLMPSGMMVEVQELERCGKKLLQMGETLKFPLEEQVAAEITATAKEMGEVCRAVEEQVGGLLRKVREVFHRIVRTRAEVVKFGNQGCRSSASPSS